ncbi:hypothetical protein D3C75_833260 [compost metagenome]
MLEKSRAIGDGVADFLAHQGRADRLIASTEPLGNGDQVRGNSLLLCGEQCAGAAHTTHDLVEDQQNAVAVANLANALEIARHRNDRA